MSVLLAFLGGVSYALGLEGRATKSHPRWACCAAMGAGVLLLAVGAWLERR